LQAFLNVPEDKIKVIYQSCSPGFRQDYTPEQRESIREKYQLPGRFLLNVGTIEERKNLLLLAKALKLLPGAIKLVVIGKPTAYAAKVKSYLSENGLTDRVLFLQNVPSEDLPLIYRQAEIFIYPSKFEGFGIPILEALSSGVPVIAATGSCLEESGGAQSIYIEPGDEIALAEAISSVWENKALRQKMIASGKEYAMQFSPEKIGRQIMDLYREVLEGKK
jgi:glycosyltransferase involved in cell wall biosynthesis